MVKPADVSMNTWKNQMKEIFDSICPDCWQHLIFRARCNRIHLLGSLVRKNENIRPESRYCLARLETVDHALRRCPALSAKRKRLLPECDTDVVWTQKVQEAEKAASLLLDFITRKGSSQAQEGEVDTYYPRSKRRKLN